MDLREAYASVYSMVFNHGPTSSLEKEYEENARLLEKLEVAKERGKKIVREGRKPLIDLRGLREPVQGGGRKKRGGSRNPPRFNGGQDLSGFGVRLE